MDVVAIEARMDYYIHDRALGYYTHDRALFDTGQATWGTKLREIGSEDLHVFVTDIDGNAIIIPSPTNITVLEEFSSDLFLCIQWRVDRDDRSYQGCVHRTYCARCCPQRRVHKYLSDEEWFSYSWTMDTHDFSVYCGDSDQNVHPCHKACIHR